MVLGMICLAHKQLVLDLTPAPCDCMYLHSGPNSNGTKARLQNHKRRRADNRLEKVTKPFFLLPHNFVFCRALKDSHQRIIDDGRNRTGKGRERPNSATRME